MYRDYTLYKGAVQGGSGASFAISRDHLGARIRPQPPTLAHARPHRYLRLPPRSSAGAVVIATPCPSRPHGPLRRRRPSTPPAAEAATTPHVSPRERAGHPPLTKPR